MDDAQKIEPLTIPAAAQHEKSQADSNADVRRKRFEDLRAKLALRGKFGLYELAGGEFLITMAGYTRTLPDLHAVRGFLRQIGGAE